MQVNYYTNRLELSRLSREDSKFIFELVNSEDWKKYIGDRNIQTLPEADTYIEKIIKNPDVNYWVVKLKKNNERIGIITFIKRAYLDYFDIGFALLPGYFKLGYAYEATKTILNDAMTTDNHKKVLATTISENKNSINLLNKLGLIYTNELKHVKDLLLIYSTI